MLGGLEIVALELNPGGEQQRLHVLGRELQRVAEKPQCFELIALGREELGEVIMGLDIARVLLDRDAGNDLTALRTPAAVYKAGIRAGA